MYIENQGLNGFFGDLWRGFKSVFTSTSGDDAQSSAGGKIGRKIGGFLSRLSFGIFDGMFKAGEYIPSQSELGILNTLKTSLNNYMIALVNDVDAFFLANTNTSLRIDYLNNAIRKVQIIQAYFFNNSHPGLSQNAQQALSKEIEIMVNSFELTIEELLEQNGIDYVKTEGTLTVNSSDKYPTGLNIEANVPGYGFQYKVSNPEASVISTDVPTSANNANVNLIPNQTTVVTSEVASGIKTNNKSSMLAPLLLIAFAIGLSLMPSKKNEKEK